MSLGGMSLFRRMVCVKWQKFARIQDFQAEYRTVGQIMLFNLTISGQNVMVDVCVCVYNHLWLILLFWVGFKSNGGVFRAKTMSLRVLAVSVCPE